MKRTVEEKGVILGFFKERPQKLINELEGKNVAVFERKDDNGVHLMFVCEPMVIDTVTTIITPYKDKSWDPFFVEIRDMFETYPEKRGADA